jgi:predicted molibdopterin-dependent oxidoreductase YjgC
MGITQHGHGSETVKAICDVALLRGWLGREKAGLVPIRGHSGVQGGSEVGCLPNALPGGRALDDPGIAQLWGFAPPAQAGLDARAMLDAAHDGKLDAFFAVGGNFLETMPDPAYVEKALARIPLRIHQDIVLTHQMLVDPADLVLIFPARTRYEQDGGGTETTTERRIAFSPQIQGPDPLEARNEWEPLCAIAARVRPERADGLAYADSAPIREEIARAVPYYAGIERLATKGDAVQYGGRHLGAGGVFPTPSGRAHFEPVELTGEGRAAGTLRLTTRRGKQFNSIVHQDKDPLTGASRRDLLVSSGDLAARGIADGARVLVRSSCGTFRGTARAAAIQEGNVQGFWPEVNVLLPHGPHDDSGVPDYGTEVTIEEVR